MRQDPDVLAGIMSNSALALRAIADALAADLAVSPVIVSASPGVGATTLCNEIAGALTSKHLDIRCAALDPAGLGPFPGIVDGEITEVPGLAGEIDSLLTDGLPTIFILDELEGCDPGVPLAIMRRIADIGSAPSVVILRTLAGHEDRALELVAESLGLHRAHVPTVTLVGPLQHVEQPILAIGHVDLSGSKIGIRFLEMDCQQPYEHSLRFTVSAEDDQDDDALNQALYNAIGDTGTTAVRLTRTPDGDLVCRVRDMVAA